MEKKRTSRSHWMRSVLVRVHSYDPCRCVWKSHTHTRTKHTDTDAVWVRPSIVKSVLRKILVDHECVLNDCSNILLLKSLSVGILQYKNRTIRTSFRILFPILSTAAAMPVYIPRKCARNVMWMTQIHICSIMQYRDMWTKAETLLQYFAQWLFGI